MPKFKLTDVEGKEHFLEVAKNGRCEKWSVYPVESPKPEIKVGMWVRDRDGDVFRVGLITENGGICADRNDPKKHYNWDIEYIFPATPAEIEAHLKKVCEKYVGKRVESVTIDEVGIVSERPHWAGYYLQGDEFYMTINNGTRGLCVYRQGKFAEILPDKKKRPETREEFEEMFKEFYISPISYIEFLKQYDI